VAKKAGFDLSAIIGDVNAGNSGTVELIPAEQIHPNDKNFYDICDLDGLIDAILMDGLQAPLIVNKKAEGYYEIISGHRRFEALKKIIAEKLPIREGKLFASDIAAGYIPCLVNRYDNELQAELALIRANSDNRVLSSAEKAKQVERVEMLLYQLKEQGYEFPGRMRDYVAEACKVSASRIARLKVIKDKLVPEFKELYEKGEINESVAYALAKETDELQKLIHKAYVEKDMKYLPEWKVQAFHDNHKKIFAIKCTDGNPCTNREAMWDRYIEYNGYQTACSGCCKKCSQMLSCKAVCPKLRDEVQEEKRKQRAENKAEREKKKAEEEAKIEHIRELWIRFGEARRAAGVSLEEAIKILGQYYSDSYFKNCQEEDYIKRENGEEKLSIYADTPYTGVLPQKIADLAELFGVSLEYLFCKTDDPGRRAEVWRFGNPQEPGMYWTLSENGGKLYYWNGSEWQHPIARIQMTPEVRYWMPCPPLPEGIWEKGVDDGTVKD